VPMSVQEGHGAEDLLNACVEMLESRVRRARFLIPYTRSDLAAAMHSEGKVLSTEYVEEGTLIEAVLPVAFYNKFSRFLAEK
jgi:GTP-binding protein HflX